MRCPSFSNAFLLLFFLFFGQNIARAELNLERLLARIESGERSEELQREAAFEIQQRLHPMHYAHVEGFTSANDMKKLVRLMAFVAGIGVGEIKPMIRANLPPNTFGHGLPLMVHTILTNNTLPTKDKRALITAYVANLPLREVAMNYDIHFQALNAFTGFYSQERSDPKVEAAMAHLRDCLASAAAANPPIPAGYERDFASFRNQAAIKGTCQIRDWSWLAALRRF